MEVLRTYLSSVWIPRLLRIFIAFVFISSGVSKIISPSEFASVIEAYGIVPDTLIMPLAYILPAVELVAGLGLIATKKWALITITVLLIMFGIVLSYGLWLGLDVDCGCFGPSDPEARAFGSLTHALIRDLCFLFIVLYLYFGPRLAGKKNHREKN